jgi:hypothetical protein
LAHGAPPLPPSVHLCRTPRRKEEAGVAGSWDEERREVPMNSGEKSSIFILQMMSWQLLEWQQCCFSLHFADGGSDEDVAGDSLKTMLTVDYRIKVHMNLQVDKSPVVVKGPFFPRVVNPRYRIRGTMCNARIQSSKARKAIF